MDPISIAQISGSAFNAAKGAFEVGRQLHDFIHDVRHQDDTARQFASEIEALGYACSLVGSRAQSIVQQHEKDLHDATDGSSEALKLWACLGRQVSSCCGVIQRLSTAVACISRTPGQSSNFFRQAWRQIQLNMKENDITDLRNRIKTHTSGLQLTLQSIAIEISYVIPNRVDRLLREQLNDLATRQTQLHALQAERTDSQGTYHKDEAFALAASEKVKSSGETLYSGSVLGSVFGEPLDGKATYIASWIQDANAIEEVVSGASTEITDTPSVFSTNHCVRTPSLDSVDASTLPTSMDATDSIDACALEQDDPGSDDEIAIEAAEICIAQGRAAFEKPDYAKAASILKEALKMVRELPSSRQTICNAHDVRFMLGVCTFHMEPPATAKEALLSIVNGVHGSRPQDNTRLVSLLEAGSLLAQVHVRLGELDQAWGACKSTLEGRRRVLGKTHEFYYQSLALTSRIYEIQGNLHRADIYAMMVPEDCRETLIEQFRQLKVDDGVQLRAVETPALPSSPQDCWSPTQTHLDTLHLNNFASTEGRIAKPGRFPRRASADSTPLVGTEGAENARAWTKQQLDNQEATANSAVDQADAPSPATCRTKGAVGGHQPVHIRDKDAPGVPKANSGRRPVASLPHRAASLTVLERSRLSREKEPSSGLEDISSRLSSNSKAHETMKIPPLDSEKVAEFFHLFDCSGGQHGFLDGTAANSIFKEARLPDTIGSIWMLLYDRKSSDRVSLVDFVVIMHLLTCIKIGLLPEMPSSLEPALIASAQVICKGRGRRSASECITPLSEPEPFLLTPTTPHAATSTGDEVCESSQWPWRPSPSTRASTSLSISSEPARRATCALPERKLVLSESQDRELLAKDTAACTFNGSQEPLRITFESGRPHSRYLCIAWGHLFCFRYLGTLKKSLAESLDRCLSSSQKSLALNCITHVKFEIPERKGYKPCFLDLHFTTPDGRKTKSETSIGWYISCGTGTEMSIEPFARVLLNAIESQGTLPTGRAGEWRLCKWFSPSLGQQALVCYFNGLEPPEPPEPDDRMKRVPVAYLGLLFGWRQSVVDARIVYELDGETSVR